MYVSRSLREEMSISMFKKGAKMRVKKKDTNKAEELTLKEKKRRGKPRP